MFDITHDSVDLRHAGSYVNDSNKLSDIFPPSA